jgi:hypothetical protein
MPVMPADSAPVAPGQMPASSWDIQAPYDPGEPGHVNVYGDADAGGGDKTSGTVAGAVAAAQARMGEMESDTFGQGSRIGDVMALPPVGLDPGVGSLGETDPAGAFYDPPRNY